MGFSVDDKLEQSTKEYLIHHLNKDLFLYGGFLGEFLVSICGFNCLELFPMQTNLSGKVGFICDVFTLEEYRGKGYQKQVFRYCIEDAEKMGIKNIN